MTQYLNSFIKFRKSPSVSMLNKYPAAVYFRKVTMKAISKTDGVAGHQRLETKDHDHQLAGR